MPGQAETNGRGTRGRSSPTAATDRTGATTPARLGGIHRRVGRPGKAGWAYAVLIGGDAIGDEGASLTSEGYGPVVTSAAHPAYLGARKHTNNTAELTALAELLRALLSSSPQRAGSRGIVRTDSEYAAACMMGRVTPKTNRQLAERLRSLWQRLRAKHTVTWRHVAGHSGNKWNDYVDELAARGRQGDRGSNAADWADGTIPTNTPDEESSAEGGDSSTIGHGAKCVRGKSP